LDKSPYSNREEVYWWLSIQ